MSILPVLVHESRRDSVVSPAEKESRRIRLILQLASVRDWRSLALAIERKSADPVSVPTAEVRCQSRKDRRHRPVGFQRGNCIAVMAEPVTCLSLNCLRHSPRSWVENCSPHPLKTHGRG